MTTTKHERPTGTPAGIESTTRPTELTGDQLAIAHRSGDTVSNTTTAATTAQTTPLLHPPGTAGATANLAGAAITANIAGAWQTKQVLALYNTRGGRNGWVYLDGVGWRQLATTNDSAHAALGALSSAARTTGGSVVARDEADGQIHEIYLW